MAEACYTPQYIPASFRGVPFEAEESSSEHGRRGATGEFPFGENTAYQDLGRKIRRYNVKGRYVTNNHVAASSSLIAACETPGPGLLVHPTRGAVMAACVSLRVTDDPLNEQGITHVDMEFVEANLATGGIGSALVSIGLGAIGAAVGGMLDRQYRIQTAPYFDVQQIQSTTASIVAGYRTEFSRAINGKAKRDDWYTISAMDSLVSDPAQMRTPTALFKALDRSSKALAATTDAQQKFDSFKRIANESAKVSSLDFEGATVENAVFAASRLFAVMNMVRALMETPVKTIDLALRQYDQAVEIINQELDAAKLMCENDLFIELRKFESETKASLLYRAYKLPALVAYDFGGPVHSLVAAYEIYADATRFSAIEQHNPNRFPFANGPIVIAARQ